MLKRLIVISLICLPLSLMAKNKNMAIDYVALAALLVKGGDYIKADEALDKEDVQRKGIDFARYYTIKGLIKLHLQQYENARDSYLRAQQSGQDDPSLWIYLAQAYYGLEDYNNVLIMLEKSKFYWVDKPRVWLMRSLSYWALQDFDRTMESLLTAESRFPDEKQFSQRKIFLLIELGLYQEAVQVGLELLEKDSAEIIDYQTIGKAMIEAGQYIHALPILEKAVLHYPEDLKLLRTLSRVYVLQNQFYSAATILERAAAQDSSLHSEVAELYRKSKKSELALYFNQISEDQNRKFKQRLAIYLDDGRFDDAIGMKNSLYRVGLLKDSNIRYALAYAYFSVGRYQQAEKYLDGLRQADLFRKATQLRKAMLACEKSPQHC